MEVNLRFQNLLSLTLSPCRQGEREPEALVGCADQGLASGLTHGDVNNPGWRGECR
jgi:hypothetical protein